MKRLMLKYLDSTYSNVCWLDTKWGEMVYSFGIKDLKDYFESGRIDGGWFYTSREIVSILMKLFSVDSDTAEDTLKEWLKNRPKCEGLTNSTNGFIYKPKSSDPSEN